MSSMGTNTMLFIFINWVSLIVCRRQMKDALAKLEKEVQELHKEEQGKLEEEKKKALDRLQRLVSDCKVYKFVDTY